MNTYHKKNTLMADKKLLSKLEFVSFCIEQYKVATNRSCRDIE